MRLMEFPQEKIDDIMKKAGGDPALLKEFMDAAEEGRSEVRSQAAAKRAAESGARADRSESATQARHEATEVRMRRDDIRGRLTPGIFAKDKLGMELLSKEDRVVNISKADALWFLVSGGASEPEVTAILDQWPDLEEKAEEARRRLGGE